VLRETIVHLVVLVAIVTYAVPSIVAYRRKHPRKAWIVSVSLLLGWTVVGWFVAIIWAIPPEWSWPTKRVRPKGVWLLLYWFFFGTAYSLLAMTIAFTSNSQIATNARAAYGVFGAADWAIMIVLVLLNIAAMVQVYRLKSSAELYFGAVVVISTASQLFNLVVRPEVYAAANYGSGAAGLVIGTVVMGGIWLYLHLLSGNNTLTA